jgi:transcriptional antiterminator NusG
MSDDETTVTDDSTQTDEAAAEAPVDDAATDASAGDAGPSPEVIAEALADEVAAARGPELDEVSDLLAEQAVADALESNVVDEDELLAESTPAVVSPYDRPGKWYVLHTQSGYENKVRQNIEARTKSMGMEGRIHEIAIPMEEVTEFKQGKKVVAKKKMFPGYLLIRCSLNDDSWYVIRNTPGVTGFVGAANKPSPLSRKDVENFITVPDAEGTEEAPKRARPRLEFELNESVRVKEGPFADFSGEIVEINEDHLKMKVLVNIFGRETPVELEFSQVAKL